ncbi:MAG: hypothetical protein JWQ57_2271 [Mucilaginibacter sp.]|nr:hypothetical protein [Mucilaginibacter sp.]
MREIVLIKREGFYSGAIIDYARKGQNCRDGTKLY